MAVAPIRSDFPRARSPVVAGGEERCVNLQTETHVPTAPSLTHARTHARMKSMYARIYECHGRYVCIYERGGGGGGGGGDLFYALGESGIHRRRQTERESERDGESM